MPRLLVNPGTANAWHIDLPAGVTTLGRSSQNDFSIEHPSISSSHCRITVEGNSTTIEDLGSTNGTFVGGVAVRGAVLQNGQSVRLGQVELAFYSELGASAPHLSSGEQPLPLEASPHPAPSVTDPPAPKVPPPMFVGAEACKFHQKTPARFQCPSCGEFFCDACVALRGSGAKFCRHCGTECIPVLAEFGPAVELGFFARLPGAFAYPMRGAGVIVVVVGIALCALLKAGYACLHYKNLRIFIFGIIIEIFAGGYLFTFLQSIIHSTSAEDRELPDLPGISNFAEDVVVPFFRLLGLLLLCFGPTIGVALWAAASHDPTVALVSVVLLACGLVYFPMAFLSVAIHDSVAAANPLVVAPSVLKVIIPYLCCLSFLGLVVGVQYGGGLLLAKWLPGGLSTESMKELFVFLTSIAFLSFFSLYLLLVAVHLLGLLFVTQKARLGWLRPA